MNKIKKLERQASKYLTKKEKQIIKNYVKGYKNIDKEIAKLYKNYADSDGKLYMEEMVKYSRLKKLDNDLAKAIVTIYSTNTKLINETLRSIMNKSYKEVVNQTKVKSILKPVTITDEVNKLVSGIDWKTRNQKHMADIIYKAQGVAKAGLENGKTYKTMAKELKEIVGKEVDKPVRMIRTEGHRIRESGKLNAAKDLQAKGVEVTKTWLSMGDEKVRSSHQAMDGQTVRVDEDFTLPSGVKTQAPGMSGIAEEDINCRCIVVYNIKE